MGWRFSLSFLTGEWERIWLDLGKFSKYLSESTFHVFGGRIQDYLPPNTEEIYCALETSNISVFFQRSDCFNSLQGLVFLVFQPAFSSAQ